jgi:NAD(P)-dependent dehydrogenase (short-subunit alcohol dehydrogenase family)
MTNVVIVTGGAGALGSAVVKTLLERGVSVAAVDIAAADSRLNAMTRALGERCIGIAADVRDGAAWRTLIETVTAKLGAVTGAALIAGAWSGASILDAESDSTFERMNALNLDTAYRSLRALIPTMVAQKNGSVVVVGSRAVDRPWESAGAAAYAASKSAVVALARATAAEVLESGVRINAVLPSTIDTPANRAAMPNVDPSKWVSAESLARVIAFLLSEDARDVSGAAIPVYGRA